jgi:hypothetical protein
MAATHSNSVTTITNNTTTTAYDELLLLLLLLLLLPSGPCMATHGECLKALLRPF